MRLVNELWENVLQPLAVVGWSASFNKIQLNLDVAEEDRESELAKVVDIDPNDPSFQDFALDRAKLIEPGEPAHSLLFHVLASPAFAPSQGNDRWPTPENLSLLLNVIFALRKMSLDQVVQAAVQQLGISDPPELAVGVFASEYRSSDETTHRRHADLCFSRCAVARVGTTISKYDGRTRSYVAHADGDAENVFRVIPSRYSVYLAVLAHAENGVGPLPVLERELFPGEVELDRYWIPIHKLFSGDECLSGVNLNVKLSSQHFNQKLEKLLDRLGSPIQVPVTQSEQIATTKQNQFDELVVRPRPAPLVETVTDQSGQALSFVTPAMQRAFSPAFRPTLTLPGGQLGSRPWPEYSHIRTELRNGQAVELETDASLNRDLQVFLKKTSDGGYDAVLYRDNSGDGWVECSVDNRGNPLTYAGVAIKRLPAYSIVAAPDFYPRVNQRALLSWWIESQSGGSGSHWLDSLFNSADWKNIWLVRPDDLASVRAAANLAIPGNPFKRNDTTMTGIVGLPVANRSSVQRASRPVEGQSTLTDAAAGLFAPGWDTSWDIDIESTSTRRFLANHGLGSPFPEDAKLCAALSTYWPAAAPDTTRNFVDIDNSGRGLNLNGPLAIEFANGVVCPMTDAELGENGNMPWDGIRGPYLKQSNSGTIVASYPVFSRGDYTLNALKGQMSMAVTAGVSLPEYQTRMVDMARCYRATEISRQAMMILSYSIVDSNHPDVIAALSASDVRWPLSGVERIARFVIFEEDEIDSRRLVDKERRVELTLQRTRIVLISRHRGVAIAVRVGDGTGLGDSWTRFPE